MEKQNTGLIGLGAALAIGLILSTWFAAAAFEKIKLKNGTIIVKGYAQKQITADYGQWKGVISARAELLSDAYDKLEKSRMLIMVYLARNGIPIDEVANSAIRTETLYERTEAGVQKNHIQGYVLSQDFSYHSHDMQKLAQVAQGITVLIKDGVQIDSYPPEYFYGKLDEVKLELLGEAAKDARQRAERLAEQSGNSIGSLRSAQQGVFQVTPAWSTSFSDYGEMDTTAIDKRIKAVVTMEFSIH